MMHSTELRLCRTRGCSFYLAWHAGPCDDPTTTAAEKATFAKKGGHDHKWSDFTLSCMVEDCTASRPEGGAA